MGLLPLFMHTDAERNYAAKAARIQCASREDKSSLLDCTGKNLSSGAKYPV
jgi:hypothetical protein